MEGGMDRTMEGDGWNKKGGMNGKRGGRKMERRMDGTKEE